MTTMMVIFFLILSYLIGSIPFGLLIGKIFLNVDIREHGSKNTGATNTVRVLGFKYGIFAFIFDMLKGSIIIIIVRLINDPSLFLVGPYDLNFSSLYGLAAVLGHVYPVYLKFKGGKAVATSCGMIFAIEPWVAVAIIIVFSIVFLITRYVSVASTFSAGVILIYFAIRVFYEHPNYNLPTRIMDFAVIIFLGFLIINRHKLNYERLRKGTEFRFLPKRRKQKNEESK